MASILSNVTLHVSVWVEMMFISHARVKPLSRSTWACELKFICLLLMMRLTLSRSTWACELKYCVLENVCKYICHAPRERVSWNRCYLAADCLRWRHAPRERVSWNERSAAIVDFQPWSRSTWACELKLSVSSADRLYIRVTLHVSVWVEIFARLFALFARQVTLHVSVWVEMMIAGRFSISVSSRSTWACELKSSPPSENRLFTLSRSTWACELKLNTIAVPAPVV